MVLSRGLVISLGVSALGCTLLFLYFRHRITNIENKVNVMFDLIQNHPTGPPQQYHHEERSSDEERSMNEQNLTENKYKQAQENTLIEVSDDEDNDEQYHSDDSMEVSDDSDDEQQKTLSLEGARQISLNQDDVKKIIVPLSATNNNDNDDLPELEIVDADSLDDPEFDGDTSENEDDESKTTEMNQESNNSKILVTKSEDLDTAEPFDYTKLRVPELKAMCEAKGLANYKKLKKSPLIELLKLNE